MELLLVVLVGFLVHGNHGNTLAMTIKDPKTGLEGIRGLLTDELIIEALTQAKRAQTEEDRSTRARGSDIVTGMGLRAQHLKQFYPELDAHRFSAMVMEKTMRNIAENLTLPIKEAAHALRGLKSHHIDAEVSKAKPALENLSPCDHSNVYRTCTGRCNNLRHSQRGATLTPFSRLIQADYSDGISKPRIAKDGSSLPNARLISMNVFRDVNNPSSRLSHMVMVWGQFLEHDLAHTAWQLDLRCFKSCGLVGECYGIPIPTDDHVFRDKGFECMSIGRNAPAMRNSMRPRDQSNIKTSFIDGSQVYGDTASQCIALSVKQTGMLLERTHPAGCPYKNLLPAQSGGFCRSPNKGAMPCFYSGDHRVNDNPGLASMHTIWSHEHNRLLSELKKLNHHWTADKLFFEARKIVGAEMQHITYNEFLPLIFSFNTRKQYGLLLRRSGFFYGYSDEVDPSILNSFTTSAFRFGHSLIQNQFNRYLKDSDEPIKPAINMNRYFDMSFLYDIFKGGVDSIMRGLSRDAAQKSDGFFSKAVQEELVRGPGDAADLAAINIQRGRDHGIPGYTAYRRWAGLPVVDSYDGLRDVMADDKIKKLSQVYDHVDDVDMYPGGLYETPLDGGILGPTFTAIIATQFQRLRAGDRFWYENNACHTGFTAGQLAELRKVSLARVICDNVDNIVKMQKSVLTLPSSRDNPVVSCASLPRMDLRRWTEIPGQDRCASSRKVPNE